MLSTDLLKRYGNDSGYSIRNLKYMRQFAVEYPDFPFVQVPLAQFQDNKVLPSLSFKEQHKGRIRLARDDSAFRCGSL